MLKKLINRNQCNQIEINGSVLRDIIPSNDLVISKKPQEKRFINICKIFILTFILGLIAIGIVVLALVLTFSGKSFMNYFIHPSRDNLLTLSNKTRALTFDQKNKQNWTKITIIPANNTQQVYIPSSTIRNEQLTSNIIQATQENRITTAEIFTSTFFIKKIRDTETIPLTTQTVLQSSIKQNKKYKKLEEDDIIDDILYP